MRTNIYLCLFVFLFVFNQLGFSQDIQTPIEYKAIKKWETPQQFKTPESVIYDASRDICYVSNVNGSPAARDGNGFISKLSPDGKLIQLEWINGLNGPKGMTIYQDKLYVADIDRVAEIDLASGKILQFFKPKDAIFLNDATVDKNGIIYISDTGNDRIYFIKNGKIDSWLSSDKLKEANGVRIAGEKLLVGTAYAVQSVDLKSKKIKTLVPESGNIDGLVDVNESDYFFSDFNGKICWVRPPQPYHILNNTTAQNIKATDIEFIKEKKLLLVPTFNDNRVMAYEIVIVKL